MNETFSLLLLRQLRVQNANAVSGPLSWGFPSPTAFTGFAHALQRRLDGVELGGVGIVCHRFEPQIDQPHGSWRPGYFRLARHPYIAGYKKFQNKASAIVEEGRAHMEVSLLIEIRDDLDEDEQPALLEQLARLVPGMRLAGGSILDVQQIKIEEWPPYADEQQALFRKLRYRLLPGFALVERRDLLADAMNEHKDPLTAFLDPLALHWEPPDDEEAAASEWRIRPRAGWIVPVPVGYAALSELYAAGEVNNSRDAQTPFRFVESLYTLGQWVGPHRLARLEQLIWHNQSSADKDLYLCRNRYTDSVKEDRHA